MLTNPEAAHRFIEFVVGLTNIIKLNRILMSYSFFLERGWSSESSLGNFMEMAPSNGNRNGRHRQSNRGRQPNRGRQSNNANSNDMVRCQYCSNFISMRSMQGHLLRKHSELSNERILEILTEPTSRSITQQLIRSPFRSPPRPQARPPKRNNHDMHTEVAKQEHRCVKRLRLDENFHVDGRDNGHDNGHVDNRNYVLRPETPPDENPEPENFNSADLPLVQFDDKNYNLVHISDQQLNRFMQFGKIRIQNGQLYMKDTDEHGI